MNKYDLNLIKKDLNNYYNYSNPTIGFSSSHASFVAQLEGASSHTDASEYDKHIINNLEQIEIISNIYRTLQLIPPHDRRLMEATYSYEYQQTFQKEIPQIYHIFKSKTGSALISCNNKKLLTTLCMNTMLKKMTPVQTQQLFVIRKQASHLFDLAHYNYLTQRKKVFCVSESPSLKNS